ncbi:MAG: hypothetical protein U9N59_00220 [Campylobacterota bacterium]|nr:hypothetical protein [Campylobacterota bacterium]
MRYETKKTQIIKSYIDEIVPCLNYTNFQENLIVVGILRCGTTKKLKSSNLAKYIKFEQNDSSHLTLDFSNSTIKDVYKGLSIISKNIKSA